MGKVVLFGSEIVGKQAIDYFGKENVICFCDNNLKNVGKIVEGKRVISFSELVEMHSDDLVIIATSKNSSPIIEKQLNDCGVIHNIRFLELKLWMDDNCEVSDFFNDWTSSERINELRNTIVSYGEICRLKQQIAFFKEHTDITTLLPAKGKLREHQLIMTSVAKIFSDYCESIGVEVFLDAGNQIGAIRHKGYVPWDDDFDFAILRSDYDLLEANLERGGKLFASDSLVDYTLVQLASLVEKYPNTIIGYRKEDTLKIYYGTCLEDMKGLDVWIFDYIADGVSFEDYMEEIKYIEKERLKYNSMRERIDFVTNYTHNSEKISLEPTSIIHMGPESLIQFPKFKKNMWISYTDVFPLKKMRYEDTEFFCPHCEDAILKLEYPDYMSFPDDVGVVTHG